MNFVVKVAKQQAGEDDWKVWIFPEGSLRGPVRSIHTWDDIEVLAAEYGFDDSEVEWDPDAVAEMTAALGAPQTPSRPPGDPEG
jgi:hypothetical protein